MRQEGWRQYKESLKYLASGSSTSSKIPIYENIEPPLIVKGKGCRVWDVDGNEYIDFRNALGPVSIGYSIDQINSQIKEQLDNGIIFGHPSPIEGEVAKLLVENIPCAEKVRFLKTGGEAISACIKIARAFTGKNKIVHCGYNGWLNNLALGEGMPPGISKSQPLRGVPQQISSLHFTLPWAVIERWIKLFEKEGNDIAAVVVASAYQDMEKGEDFLPQVRELTRRYDSLMIMDEIVTGFRLAIGGAHQYFNFLPDMAVFGKAMANGMPISAYLGKSELIELAREIGISSTFGGETLSLASAKATIRFYTENEVTSHLWQMGNLLKDGINEIFKRYNFPCELKGFGPCPQFVFKDDLMKDRFFQGCYRNGVSFYHVVYVNYSHKEKDIEETLERVEETIRELKDEDAR
ncbi:MAG: aminotransferase class III-fold pyridoxal phosphate-dependent enzyme [Dictyoglomi bacterium]|nr:aminotransferase class III-fold pyridoxal phosphate-dependent enzyme [Dictyoglomota bacterium]HHV81648.1 aminotransferase class III-fold pyridoxal phosphate-dependent enzyme [bacterium]